MTTKVVTPVDISAARDRMIRALAMAADHMREVNARIRIASDTRSDPTVRAVLLRDLVSLITVTDTLASALTRLSSDITSVFDALALRIAEEQAPASAPHVRH